MTVCVFVCVLLGVCVCVGGGSELLPAANDVIMLKTNATTERV